MTRKYKFLKKDTMIVPVKIGWSWTVFIFSEIALLIRGQLILALSVILFQYMFTYYLSYVHISIVSPLSTIVLMLIRIIYAYNANELLEKRLISKGFTPFEK